MDNLKQISNDELKRNLIKLLQKFDEICRDNDIKYTLVGGSLIGAVRHNGIIPWDDDVDVGLSFKDYNKLLKLVRKNYKYEDYIFMSNDNNSTYYYPFLKFVDTKTIVIEDRVKRIDNYGIFLDIFCYNNLPKNKFLQMIYCYKLKFGIGIISGYATETYKRRDKYYLIKKAGKIISLIFGINKCIKWFNKQSQKYNKHETGLMIINWPSYKIKNEIIKSSCLEEYINAQFDGMEAMISSSYDEILTNLFGNYMELPPIDKRINHNMKVYKK